LSAEERKQEGHHLKMNLIDWKQVKTSNPPLLSEFSAFAKIAYLLRHLQIGTSFSHFYFSLINQLPQF